MIMKYSASVLFTAGLAAAQTSVVNIMFPFVDQQDNGASVISAGPTATKYFIACPPGTSDEDCGLAEGVEVLYGPSTLEYTMTRPIAPGRSSRIRRCRPWLRSSRATAPTSCPSPSPPGSRSSRGPPTRPHPAALPPDVPSASTPTTMTTASVPTGATEGSGEGAADPTSSQSTGGMPRVTQNAVIMGAAALVGGAILL
ncbi:hypothetical protein CHGG_03923 [Chaetomium globosum CBS 148.51]|uniref:Autophagy-related protein 27 n=1 Tax=Chaetomium globosum (strain ATCC 6205 / CBS 148.51 / DSM 1962 / NBRC 6347 / NRRL 1970) TaxID=306901 RepID=Q2H2S3_CHAGB|nr:uncharacterized protein CHGG_03923 [Chaetomium globosum CBS 148.51]EAQ87304.1 hypothetical protein CHGG_03923 [Chaetomium globosum CBS 148.51]